MDEMNLESLQYSTFNGSDLDAIMELQNEVLMNFTEHIIHAPEKYDIMQQPVLRKAMLAIYILVIAIGVVGNDIVIFVVACRKNMHNVTNIFIANLALSDIGLGVFCLPMQLHYQLTDHWIFGEIMCRVIFAAFAVPMYVSSLTILLLAFDQYWLIIYPLRQRMTKQMAFISIIISTLVSILLAIPVIIFTKCLHVVEPEINLDRVYCVEEWPSDTTRLIYTILTFHFLFWSPLLITLTLTFLSLRIYCRSQLQHTHEVTNRPQKQKTNRIFIVIVMLFLIRWFPWNLFNLMIEIDPDIILGRYFKMVDLTLRLIAMGSSCINPFLYGCLNFCKEHDNMAIKLHIIPDKSRNNQSEMLQSTQHVGENVH